MSFPDSPPSSPLLSSSTSPSESEDPDILSFESDPSNFPLRSVSGEQDDLIASSGNSSQIQWGDPVISREDFSTTEDCDLTARWSDSGSSSKSTIQQKEYFSSSQTSPIVFDCMLQEPSFFLIPNNVQEVNRYRGHSFDRSIRATLAENCRSIGVMKNAGDPPNRGD
jgi:hypothetical protein